MQTILRVEDNEMNRDMLLRRLERKGYRVITATDGAEGYDLARSQSPDIILMDISLPVMNGWELTRLLKSELKTSRIPVIALTGHALTTDRAMALEVGCDDYDTKPIDFVRLQIKIEKLIFGKGTLSNHHPAQIGRLAQPNENQN